MAALLAMLAAVLFGPPRSAAAHDLAPTTLDLRLGDAGIDARLSVPAAAALHGWPVTAAEATTASPGDIARQKEEVAAFLAERLVLLADDAPMTPNVEAITAMTDRTQVRLRYAGKASEPAPRRLVIRCRLFPNDPQHRTLLNIWRGGADGNGGMLELQGIFDAGNEEIRYRPGAGQGVLAVVGEFVAQGVHHIFIGPDHILFIIGLLLLGGGLKQLLKIVTAFTLAHSITLVLATLGIVQLPPRLVESVIALSIVVAGVHALLKIGGPAIGGHQGDERRGDARLLFAFGFGLIHGFGFASVLADLDLPRQALGWSLLSFNLGVEFGQAGIVLLVVPLLALLRRQSVPAAHAVVTAGALIVIAAGAFWFVERAFGAG